MADVIVALDTPSSDGALRLVDRLGDRADFYKVGLELFTRAGPDVVRELRRRGRRVFLDLKLHDIPNTVAGAVRAAAAEDVDLLTVHCAGGEAMMRAAADACADAREGTGGTGGMGGGAGDGSRLRLLGVTVLTSASGPGLSVAEGGDAGSLTDEVVRLAAAADAAGLHGAVASPLEARALRRALGEAFLVVTPGIRLPGGERHDQSRVATPAVAVEAGADFLVVGRAITAAADPVAALEAVRAGMDGVARAGAGAP